MKKTLQIFLGKKKEKPTVRPKNGLDFTKSAQRVFTGLFRWEVDPLSSWFLT